MYLIAVSSKNAIIGSDWNVIKMNHSLNYKSCYAGYKIAEFYNTEGAANPVRVCGLL